MQLLREERDQDPPRADSTPTPRLGGLCGGGAPGRSAHLQVMGSTARTVLPGFQIAATRLRGTGLLREGLGGRKQPGPPQLLSPSDDKYTESPQDTEVWRQNKAECQT